MRALVLRDSHLIVDDVPEPPRPGPNDILVQTVAAGICGSDLHVHRNTASFLEISKAIGNAGQVFDPAVGVVLGHELSFRVLEKGSDVATVDVGDFGTGYPMVTEPDGSIVTVGYSNKYPGGFGERMLLDARGAFPLPIGLDPVLAALTEPLTVGEVSVRRSAIAHADQAVVLGSGPIGLGTLAALKRRGLQKIIVSEPSESRRAVAGKFGASDLVDPASESWLDALDGAVPAPYIFNTTGRKGMFDAIIRDCPAWSHIVEVSGLMEQDWFWPVAAVIKNLTVQFSSDGGREPFRAVLASLVDGSIDAGSLVTAQVGLDDAAGMFAELEGPHDHLKVLVRPDLS